MSVHLKRKGLIGMDSRVRNDDVPAHRSVALHADSGQFDAHNNEPPWFLSMDVADWPGARQIVDASSRMVRPCGACGLRSAGLSSFLQGQSTNRSHANARMSIEIALNVLWCRSQGTQRVIAPERRTETRAGSASDSRSQDFRLGRPERLPEKGCQRGRGGQREEGMSRRPALICGCSP
jgi:hypothetical protein